MTMTERMVWASLVVFPLVGIVYFAVIVARALDAPVAEVSWVAPMLWAWGAIVVFIVAGTIASAIATGVRAEAAGETPEWEDGDVRDKQIELLGNARGYTLAGLGSAAAAVLAMLDADPFWIAHALFLSGIVTGVIVAATKLRAYRGGF